MKGAQEDYKKILRKILSNKLLTNEQKLYQIKRNLNSNDYKEALKMSPLLYKHLLQNHFFYSIDDVYQKDAYAFTGKFRSEFRWATIIIENFLPEINLFIEQKLKFEEKFLLNDFEGASKTLEYIKGKFGINVWTIESELLLEEYTRGTEENWDKLSYFLEKINNPFYEFMVNSSSKRVEAKLTYKAFVSQFQNDLFNINSSEAVKDFLVFKNLCVANYDYTYQDLAGVVYISNILPVIDQYLLIVDVIIYNISKSVEFDKIIFSFIDKIRNVVSNDLRIGNIYNVLNNLNDLHFHPKNNFILDGFDAFYSGDFSKSLEISRNSLVSNPAELENYVLYCKSLINLELEFVNLNISNLIDGILEDLYGVFKFEKYNGGEEDKLLKTSVMLINTNIGKQIFGLIAEINGAYETAYFTSILSSVFNSPKNLLVEIRANNIINNFKALAEKHCVKVFIFKSGREVNFTGNISNSILQSEMLKSLHLFKRGEFAEVVRKLVNSDELNTINYYLELKLSILFISYLELNDIRSAIELYGEIFFDDSYLVKKINSNLLFEKIKDLDKSEFVDFIELPILYSIFSKEYDVYEVFDDFLINIGITNIREIDIEKFIEKFTIEKVVYFLYNIATVDTLKYSTDYASINDVEEERVYVLNRLIEIDEKNKLKYEKEISNIYRSISVRNALKEVDEGRLYVDVNNLKELQIKNFKDTFKRFKEIETLSSYKNLIGFNASSIRSWENEKVEKSEKNDSYNRADYLAFKNIYLELRDNFLFSKEYGLDSCLSTRIRHGALKNHIRSVFEKLDLVTSKYNNEYIDNFVWSNQLGNYPYLSLVQDMLKEFSKNIDDYTVYIVDKLIQIKTEKTLGKEEGLFGFFTSDEVLYKFYSQSQALFDSVESTIDILLNDLVTYTLFEVQSGIIEYFSSTINIMFQSIIDNLISALREINLPSGCELIPNLTKSSTDIQNELDSISNWFYLNTTSSASLLMIDTIINASLELTNKINPNFKIYPQINIGCELFSGYSSLVFVFNILFNNIIQHSHLPIDEVDICINIDADGEDKYRIVKVSNNLNNNCDYTENINKLNKIKENWNNHENIERSNKEGESGFNKIKRILVYELFTKYDKFDFVLSENKISILLYLPYVIIKKDEQNFDY